MNALPSSSQLIRVLTVDDHPLPREGIAAVIEGQSDMRLVGEATNGREAIERYRALRPDVTLMDLRMPDINGIEAITAIRGEFRPPASSCSRRTPEMRRRWAR
jgi:DNA-binding NarL/FixJ family response regulator